MRIFLFRVTAYGCLFNLYLSLCWSVTHCSNTHTLTPKVTNTSTTTKPSSDCVSNVVVISQSETSVTIQFERVGNITNYKWYYYINGANAVENITDVATNSVVHTLDRLTAAQTYNMTLSCDSDLHISSGWTFNATTAPENVATFEKRDQNESSITLHWMPQPNVLHILMFEDKEENITNSEEYVVSNLSSSKIYHFTLFSVFEGIRSTGANLTAATAPPKAKGFKKVTENETSITLQWTNEGFNYTLKFDKGEENFTAQELHHPATYTVTGLDTATTYTFTLFTVSADIRGDGVTISAAPASPNPEGFKALTQNETSITLQWEAVPNVTNYILQSNKNKTEINGTQTTVSDLKSATLYTFILFSVFGNVQSSGANLTAATAPQNPLGFEAYDQNETSITLQWVSVPDVMDYILEFNKSETIVTGNRTSVSNLTSGTLYSFTLSAVFETIKSSGTQLTAATVPEDTSNFQASNQTEDSITLQWSKVNEIKDYVLENDGKRVPVQSSESLIQYKVPNLLSGTLYSFTLYTEFENLSSHGVRLEAPTVPPKVSSVKVTNRALTSITLEWDSSVTDWNYFLEIDGSTRQIDPHRLPVIHNVDSLRPGTVYPFAITTNFKHLNSSQKYENRTATVIDCDNVNWHVTESSIKGVIVGEFTKATATNGSQSHVNSGTNASLSFTGLYPGATYTMELMYEELEQCRHRITILPPGLTAGCKNWAAGYSVYIEWNKPSGIWDSVEVNISDQTFIVAENGEQNAEIPNFQPAKQYEVSISSISKTQKSSPYVFMCATDARGVIAGAFFGVVLFVLLVCVVVFVMLKRPDFLRPNKSVIGRARVSAKKSKSLPVAKFPSHFHELSADENRGFSEEYEDLAVVGTELTQKAAVRPENKPKNRFVNVLPYDRSRVKLTSSTSHDDYINASYMPGYTSDREYIAAQGPTPSTVNDFWRMIWEQKVRGIVMVTNCTEGGRIKCDQYWPPDGNCRVCEDLAVFTTFEEKESSWTLREFKVKHRCTSEERTVKHFHFTAWPDHGVPQGTDVLIQFRTLVRQHIQREAAGTPTVVHCSAGVGRTGTIVALDVLLQQLEKEKAVDIYGFVYRMRLQRPHMVQTESQYVFLHQCIMDILQPNEKCEENIYENDLIYANATALREFQNNMNKT